MKKKQLFGIVFIIVVVGIIVANIAISIIYKNKEAIVLNNSNIEEKLKYKTIGQKFKIESNSYEIISQFYVGSSSDSQTYPITTFYDNTYFIIHIKGNGDDGYYIAAKVKSEKNKENDLLTNLKQGKNVDLIGMIGDLNVSYGNTKIKDVFYSALGNNKNNVLEYCINM